MNSVADTPQELAVTLRFDEAIRGSLRGAEGALAVAREYVIEDGPTAELANAELRSVIQRKKRIEELRVSFVKPARDIISAAQGLFTPALAALEEAEAFLKDRLLEWNRKEEERIAAEQRARMEAERKARQEAEAKAAAERARAEQQAAEARRKAQEAEEARRRAEAEGNARAAAAAAAKAAEAEAKAQAALEQGEAKALEAQMVAAAQVAVPVAEVVRPKGFSARDNWIAELEPGKTEDDAKLLICQAIVAGRLDLLPMLALDMKSAGRLAKALKSSFAVPGMRARNVPVAASRAA